MKSEEKMKIGITGTRTWGNRSLIKTFIFKLRSQTTRPIVIVGLGDKHGADPLIKKFALEFDYPYQEVNAPHTVRNLYSLMPEAFYDKPYSPKNFYLRNKVFATYVDSCVVFDDCNGTDVGMTRVISLMDKLKKQVVIVN